MHINCEPNPRLSPGLPPKPVSSSYVVYLKRRLGWSSAVSEFFLPASHWLFTDIWIFLKRSSWIYWSCRYFKICVDTESQFLYVSMRDLNINQSLIHQLHELVLECNPAAQKMDWMVPGRHFTARYAVWNIGAEKVVPHGSCWYSVYVVKAHIREAKAVL